MKLPIMSAQVRSRPQVFMVSKIRCGLSSPSLSWKATMRSLRKPAQSAETSGPSCLMRFSKNAKASMMRAEGSAGRGRSWISASRVSASPALSTRR